MNTTKTKSQLKREIKAARNDYQVAEILHGYNSPERIAAIQRFWDLQSDLGKIELAEISRADTL